MLLLYIGQLGGRSVTMIRKQVYIEPKQQQKLRRVATRRGCTEAEVVREAIDLLPEPESTPEDLFVARLAAAGLRAPRPLDDDPMTDEEEEQLQRELDEWAMQAGPIGLSEAVMEERRGR